LLKEEAEGRSERARFNVLPDRSKSDSHSALRFAREMRQRRKSCPLCTFVQSELEKGNGIPIEEWIYLTHLEAAHEIIP
jgi:hypothetical protein